MASTKEAIFFVLLGLALVAFHVVAYAPSPRYAGFKPLAWPEGRCVADQLNAPPQSGNCKSEELHTQFPLAEFTVALGEKNSTRVELSRKQDDVRTYRLEQRINWNQLFHQQWKQVPISLGQETRDRTLSLRVRERKTEADGDWIAVRNRVTFYDPGCWWKFWRSISHPFSLAIFSLCVGGLLAIAVARFATLEQISLKRFAAVLLFVGLALLFKWNPFFNWDEWDVLDDFWTIGASAALHPHNEHFKPFFLLIYYWESLLFGSRYPLYLFTTLLVHVANTILLFAFLKRLGSKLVGSSRAALVLAFLYFASALHGEILQWAFEICIALSVSCSLAALWASVAFIDEGRRSQLLLVIVGTICSPLMFGSGLITAPQIVLVMLCYVATLWSSHDHKRLLQRAGVVCLSSAAAAAVTVFLYMHYGQVQTKSAPPGVLTENIANIARYFAAGTQIGTMLRGSGLLPLIEPGTIKNFMLDVGTEQLLSILFLPILGLQVAIVYFTRRHPNSRAALFIWGLGQLLLTTTFLLPSLSRFAFGPGQALSLRYQYQSLVALCVIVLGLFAWWTEQLARPQGRRARNVFVGFLVVYFASQLYGNLTWNYFRERGRVSRSYFEQYADWQTIGGGDAALQPVQPDVIHPTRTPENLYEILHRLDPTRFSYPENVN